MHVCHAAEASDDEPASTSADETAKKPAEPQQQLSKKVSCNNMLIQHASLCLSSSWSGLSGPAFGSTHLAEHASCVRACECELQPQSQPGRCWKRGQ